MKLSAIRSFDHIDPLPELGATVAPPTPPTPHYTLETPTPGVYLDPATGHRETWIPENEAARYPRQPPIPEPDPKLNLLEYLQRKLESKSEWFRSDFKSFVTDTHEDSLRYVPYRFDTNYT